ncbi:MAG: U32 family peptidase [Oscillospiraceae bacterium]|jgi:putative protease|nr:U32 family peptidase [Oscillospiraceae bacterium]
MELLVAAASVDCAASAIQNGADGVLLSPSIPPEPLGGFFPYARARGVTTILDLTRACNDAELGRRAEFLRHLYHLGLDAVMAGEPGLLRMAAFTAPDCQMIWGAPCHTADDIDYAAANGCSRAVLSPFLQAPAIQALAAASRLPLLFWALAPLCPGGDPNLCLLDKERGPYQCAEGCRKTPLAYPGDAVSPIFKTRDLCLLKHTRELSGLTALVMPPARTPEAAGLFTRFARSAADEFYIDERALREAFAALGREDPTDAPYTGAGSVYAEGDKPKNERFWEAERKNTDENPERACVPVRFFALITAGEPARLAVDDYKGHTLYAEGAVPEMGDVPDAEEELNAVWRGVSGIYRCKDARTKIDPGLCLPRPEAVALRRAVIGKLEAARLALPERKPGKFEPGPRFLPRADKPLITVKVAKMSQVTPELLRLPPERLYIPLGEASDDPSKAEWLVRSETVPVAVLPRVVTEDDRAEVNARLKRLHDAGFREALTWNPGQAVLALRQGFTPRADWGAPSSQTVRMAKLMGVVSSTLAPWLSLAEIQAINHTADTEMIVYGRLPLLLARQCLFRRKSGLCACDNKCNLSDGQGGLLPLARDGAHSTVVYHPQKLWMLPCRPLWRHIGLWAARLDFTTENARECVQIANAFAEREAYEPHAYTTGFYLMEETKKRRGGRKPG